MQHLHTVSGLLEIWLALVLVVTSLIIMAMVSWVPSLRREMRTPRSHGSRLLLWAVIGLSAAVVAAVLGVGAGVLGALLSLPLLAGVIVALARHWGFDLTRMGARRY